MLLSSIDRFREIQWSFSVVVYDLNDLNAFMITCFLFVFLSLVLIAYDKPLELVFLLVRFYLSLFHTKINDCYKKLAQDSGSCYFHFSDFSYTHIFLSWWEKSCCDGCFP